MLPYVAAAVVAALVLHGCFGGCSLPREGTLSQDCTSAATCDDLNPCTADSCSASGVCEHDGLPVGPLPDQVPQDCLRRECQDGGNYAEVEDTTDLPLDGNDCTTDSCGPDGPDNIPVPVGNACKDAGGHNGTCDAAAQCAVDCTPATAATDCDDQTPCTADSCNAATGKCVHTSLDNVPAPDAEQTVGDCYLIICNGGAATAVVDDGDTPDDANACTVDSCTEGNQVFTPLVSGDACPGGVCSDDAVPPVCVGCNLPSDCTSLPSDDECQIRTCTSHQCGQNFTPVDTALGTQTTGDCKLRVCDGAGGQKDNVQQSDLPVDGNDCTQDLCDAQGTPSNPNAALNSPCGIGGALYCDGNGSCFGCTQDSQCTPDTFCRNYGCSGNSCGFTPRNNGVALPSPPQYAGDLDQAPGDCHELRCDASGNVVNAVFNADLPADDGIECTNETCSGGTPLHPPRAVNTACTQNGGSWCDGGGSCVDCNNNNQCGDPTCLCTMCVSKSCQFVASPVPAACQVAQDCRTAVCNGSGGTSTIDNNADLPPSDGNVCTTEACVGGTPQYQNNTASCNDALYCNGTDTCAGGNCSVHAGDPCPGADGDGNCSESCNETNDNCAAPDPNGSGCTDGAFCNGADTCNGGSCSVHVGDPCPGADGDGNCSESCNETNDSCTAADPNGSSCTDGAFCNGADTCNGGSCSVHVGSPCPGADGDGNCAESCNETNDDCTANDPSGAACNNGAFCDGTETCTSGVCGNSTGDPCIVNVGDLDANCTESCNEASDNCTSPDPDGSTCTDSLFCNGADTCSSGTCTGHAGDPCPGADGDGNCSESCDEGGDTCTASDPDGSACADSLFCNGADTCSGGTCSAHAGDPCLVNVGDADTDCSESCNETSDDCTADDPDGSVCLADGLFCNGVETCAVGSCVGEGNPCTGQDVGPSCDDSCDESADLCTAADVFGTTCNEGGVGTCTGDLNEPNCVGALAVPTVTPASLTASTKGDVTIDFGTIHDWPAGGQLTIVFPAGFDVSGTTFVSIVGAAGSMTVSVAGQTVTLTRTGGSLTTAADVTVTLGDVTNPSTTGVTGTFAVATRTSGGTIIDSGTAPAVTIN